MVVARVDVPVTTAVPVVVLLVARRLVTVALVVVEFPTMRLVMLAKVATRDEMNHLVGHSNETAGDKPEEGGDDVKYHLVGHIS